MKSRKHRFCVGDRVRVVRCSPMGFPAPVGTLLTIASLDDDGWYRTPDYGRVAPNEIAPDKPKHRPTHVTVTRERWDELLTELEELRAAVVSE